MYRRVGNLNMWLARFVPLSSFTKVWSDTSVGWLGMVKLKMMPQFKLIMFA